MDNVYTNPELVTAAWQTFLPHSDPIALEKALEALPTMPGTVSDQLRISANATCLRLRWMKLYAPGTPYIVGLQFRQTEQGRVAEFTDCHVASAAPKGQGFGSAALRLGAQTVLLNGYDRADIPGATYQGLTFWPRHGAVIVPEIVAAAEAMLAGQPGLTGQQDFREGRWGDLLRDSQTERLLAQELEKIHKSDGKLQHYRPIQMIFDRDALARIASTPPSQRGRVLGSVRSPELICK